MEKPIPEKVDRALKALQETSYDYPLSALKEEYGKLFVGLGAAGSWCVRIVVQGKKDPVVTAGLFAVRPR